MKNQLSGTKPLKLALTVAGAVIALKLLVNLLFHYFVPQGSLPAATILGYDMLKDTLLIVLTGAGVFFLVYFLFRRVNHLTHALVSSERKSTAGLMGMALHHDMNNQLQVVNGYMELMLANPHRVDEKNREFFTRMQEGLTKLTDMVAGLNSLGKNSTQEQMQTLLLDDLFTQTLGMVRGHHKIKGCSVDMALEEGLVVSCHPGQIQDAVLNLMINAADAMQHKGNILIRSMKMADGVMIEIHDDGPGISKEMAEQIFQPFYTSKLDGLGLGLMSVKATAESHGGTVSVGTSHLGGAVFRLQLPAVKKR